MKKSWTYLFLFLGVETVGKIDCHFRLYRRHHRPFSAASIEISFPFFERLVPMFSIWFLKKQQKFIEKIN